MKLRACKQANGEDKEQSPKQLGLLVEYTNAFDKKVGHQGWSMLQLGCDAADGSTRGSQRVSVTFQNQSTWVPVGHGAQTLSLGEEADFWACRHQKHAQCKTA